MLRSRLPNVSAGGDYGKGLFNREMGPLQSQLHQGEYALLKLAPMLESDFVQISKREEVIDVHNQVQTVTVGVACTSPNLLVPNVLLLARPIFPPEEAAPKFKSLFHQSSSMLRFELTRLLPLSFVKISLHNPEKKQLRFKLASGRTFYLQLCPQPGTKEDVFKLWVKVVNMLRPPSDQRSKLHSNAKDPGVCGEAPPQRASPQRPQSPSSLNLEERVSIRSIYSPSEVPSPAQEESRSTRSLALSMGSQPSFRGPSCSPVESEGRTSGSEGMGLVEPLERPPSRRSRGRISHGGSRELRGMTGLSSLMACSHFRKTSKSRSSRRKSPRRSSSRKPSKIVALIRSCSWGSRRRSKSRDAKSRGKGKKR
ncbi:Golgi-associated RAB2 interactor protein 6-like [Rhineura floridana]|uniref:Golgi-associated RAB2 interactor protein 6-like n=1 Tax=Rhineura floridana TaxID=261503 RepID=UPI002AC85B3A|nr:Golgi-associated RAB2 interactor protein 6-like [Rhineura floridana]